MTPTGNLTTERVGGAMTVINIDQLETFTGFAVRLEGKWCTVYRFEQGLITEISLPCKRGNMYKADMIHNDLPYRPLVHSTYYDITQEKVMSLL